ncbi:shikimate dehydrogenase [Alphaproteobacteria bacterium]|nr:shikimate dehydrogenase [Alphaproteobacteria bacterium]
MKNFFVIGNKTSKSLSPLIFNHWFRKYNIQAKYSFVEVEGKDFDIVLGKKINDNKTTGFNVTIPFKKSVVKHLDFINSHAKNIEAVNCVTVGKKIKGINTDWVGYLSSIKDLKIHKNKNILIMGCGGASKAIVYGLFFKGFKNINVFNRTTKKIKVGKINKFTKKYSLIDKYLPGADLIINTTPINPLNKKQSKLVKKDAIVSDVVYKPKQTAFLNNFKEHKKIFGIYMLIEQAIPCFFNWFGFKPSVDDVLIKKINIKIK